MLKRLRGKSLKTIAVRGTQEANLFWMSLTGAWPRLQRKIARHWSDARVDALIRSFEEQGRAGVLCAADAEDAFQKAFAEHLLNKEPLLAHGANIRARRFKIFHHGLPADGDLPWMRDWRCGHTWPLTDFHCITHHEPRDIPYDVKYPWEVSRLWFLPPLLQKAMLNRSLGWDQGHIEEVSRILKNFESANPAGRGINWYPMETAMRGISLVLILDMLLLARAPREKIATVLRLIALSGETLWRSIEYTDNRGNHYAANIVALLAMGQALAGHYPAATKWQLYAAENIDTEILRQFLDDGVNFEKSSAYHMLVTELFLIAKLLLSRHGLSLSDAADRRLCNACHYAAALRRPDGTIPLIGDTDDARLFALEDADARDNASLLALASVLYEDPSFKAVLKNRPLSPVVPWMTGVDGVTLYQQMPVVAPSPSSFFKEGGMMVAGGHNSHLVMDAGDVGQNGVGGHGHNDLLSFDLFIEGHPFIIDPGCPTYTGEPSTRKLFRSTAWHNSLVIDNTEIADITGPFRIANQALPVDVSFENENGIYTFKAGHTGYMRLPSGVMHHRTLRFDPAHAVLACEDTLSLSAPRRADRYLHFAQGVELQSKEKSVIATLYQHRFEITFDDYSEATLMTGRVSHGYGHKADAPVLMLSTQVERPVVLFFNITKTNG